MRILITGSSGQVGTNLALHYLRGGHQVAGVDRRVNDWTDAFPCVVCDLAAPTPFERAGTALTELGFRQPDVVVHLAAHAKVHELVLDPQRAFDNVSMTYNVLEYCRRLSVPIVYASSREVYGDVRSDRVGEQRADFTTTGSAYAASKIAGESMVYAYSRCYDLNYLVFRLSNVYGRFDHDLGRMERVVPLFIHRIAEGKPITVYGAAKVLDFTYIDDCVDGFVRGIERLVDGRVRDQTFNIAFGLGHSLLQLAEYVGEALGKRPQIVTEPSRRGEVTRYVADLDKARTLLQFEPRVTLRDGVRRAVASRHALA